jgi:hypothetical protein
VCGGMEEAGADRSVRAMRLCPAWHLRQRDHALPRDRDPSDRSACRRTPRETAQPATVGEIEDVIRDIVPPHGVRAATKRKPTARFDVLEIVRLECLAGTHNI